MDKPGIDINAAILLFYSNLGQIPPLTKEDLLQLAYARADRMNVEIDFTNLSEKMIREFIVYGEFLKHD